MKPEAFDHASAVESWLKEPIWLPPGDTARVAQLVHQTPQQHGWLRTIFDRSAHHMFTATKLAVGVAVLGLVGSFLVLSGGPFRSSQTNEQVPAATVPAASPDVVPSSGPTDAPTAAPTVGPSTAPAASEDALVMGAPDPDLRAGGWSQAGSAPYHTPDGSGFGQLDHLQTVADALVALGSTLESEDGPSHDVVMRSSDGLTWMPISLPGTDPVLNDMAATDEGLVVGGLDHVDGERVAKLWTSVDGLEWLDFPAPDGAVTISQIVSAQDPLVVRVNQRIYQLDSGIWTELNRIPNSQILRGPSGYLTWQGGGQDQRLPLTLIHQASLDGAISEVGLPKPLGRGANAEIGVQLFAVGDQWVMVPEGYETPIYVSRDGSEWSEVPRPDRMLGGYVEWMGMVGDQLQAFGIQYRRNGSPSGVWTIDLASADPAPFEVLDPKGDRHMFAPVAFGDGDVATGLYMGRGGAAIDIWQHATD